MASEIESDAALVRTSPVFATTHWSVVLAAQNVDPPRAREALEGSGAEQLDLHAPEVAQPAGAGA